MKVPIFRRIFKILKFGNFSIGNDEWDTTKVLVTVSEKWSDWNLKISLMSALETGILI